MGRLSFLLALAALVLPSRLGLLAGLPLDSWPEFVLLALLVPLAVSGRLRDEVLASLGRAGLRGVAVALGVVLVAKLALLAWAPNPGFDSCYSSTLRAAPEGQHCEVSFADPFGLSGGTRVDERLDFGPRGANAFFAAQGSRIETEVGPLSQSNWNLTFFNHLRFWWYWVSGPDRDRLPFVLGSRGVIEPDRPETLRVTYVGEGLIEVGGRIARLLPSYNAAAEASLPVAAGRQSLRLRFGYRRLDLTRTPDLPEITTPYAALRVEMGGKALEAAPAGVGWRVLATLVDVLLFVLGGGLAARLAWLLRGYAPVALGVAVAIAAAHGIDRSVDLGSLAHFDDVFWHLLALVALLAVLIARPGPRPLLFAWFAVTAIATGRTFDEFPFEDSVIYPTGGSDPLTYASQGHDILASGSLQGGEDVFDVQAGFRYILFAGRFLFGAEDPWLAGAALAAMVFVVFLFTLLLRPADSPVRRWCMFAVAALMLGVMLSSPVVGNMRVHLSEAVTWTLVLLAAALLLGTDRSRWWLLGTAFLGLAFVTRQNQGLLVLVVLVAFVLSVAPERRRAALACCGAVALVGLLPLAHNLILGGSFDLFSRGADPRTTNLESIPELVDQLQRVLYLPGVVVDRSPDLRPFVYGLELAWLAAVGFALARRRRLRPAAFVLLAAPLGALAVYLFYGVLSYYPRHVIVGYLALGIATIYLLSDRATRAPT